MSKKLIEVALPLEAINAEAAREKSIRHGHPSTLHLWWARRPLAAARAVIWSSLVDDPSAHPELYPTEEAQNTERQRLFGILEKLVKWENSTGFLLHLSQSEGFVPRLHHCVHCQRRIADGESTWFDLTEGGLVCRDCRLPVHVPISAAQVNWLRTMLTTGSAGWVDSPEMMAPYRLMRQYIELRLDKPVRSAAMLPKE